MIEMIDAILENAMALGVFAFVVGVCFFCGAAAILVFLFLLHLGIRWLIFYSIRQIRRWFVQNVLIPKAETEQTFFRKAH